MLLTMSYSIDGAGRQHGVPVASVSALGTAEAGLLTQQ
jgi:hypothetical protein